MLRALTIEKMLRDHLWISYVFGVYGFWIFCEIPTSWPKCFSEPDELHRAQNIPSPQKSYFHIMTKKQLSCRSIGSHRSLLLFSHEFSTAAKTHCPGRRHTPTQGQPWKRWAEETWHFWVATLKHWIWWENGCVGQLEEKSEDVSCLNRIRLIWPMRFR